MKNIRTPQSLERSLVWNLIRRSNICTYLDLELANPLDNTSKNVLIFKDREYKFSYYDPDYGMKTDVIGLVDIIDNEYIKIKISTDSKYTIPDCSICSNVSCNIRNNVTNICNTNCIYSKPNIDKYNEPSVCYIPINNIMDVSYLSNNIEEGEN